MSHRFVLALLFGLPALGIAQGINGGFETLSPNGIPSGWSIADPSGAATTKDAHIGKIAAKSWVYKNYESGIWSNRMDPATGNASEVTGYYKYLGDKAECDKATVSYLLGARNAEGKIDTLAYGDTELKISKEYKKFSLSVSSTGNGTPEFATIQLQPSGHCNIHGETNCCFLFVDDIVFSGTTSVSEQRDPEPMPEEPAAPADSVKDAGMEEEGTDPAANPEAVPAEGKGTEAPNGEETPEVTKEAPAEEVVPAEAPGKEETAPAEETLPAEETPLPEKENNEPVDEEWDTEEESSDGGR